MRKDIYLFIIEECIALKYINKLPSSTQVVIINILPATVLNIKYLYSYRAKHFWINCKLLKLYYAQVEIVLPPLRQRTTQPTP